MSYIRKYQFILIIFLLCSCGFNRNAVHQAESEYDIETYPVNEGLDERYVPDKLLICSESKWIMSAWNMDENRKTFFLSEDKGCSWKHKSDFEKWWYCEALVYDGGAVYCSLRDMNCDNETIRSGKIRRSADFGESWDELCVFDAEIKHLLVQDSTIAVQLCNITKKETKKTVDIKYSINISNDLGKSWRELELPNTFTLDFSIDKIILRFYNDNEHLYVITPEQQHIDTILRESSSIVNVVKGEDVIGVWEGHRANFYKVEDGGLSLRSSVRDVLKPGRNQIPAEIYQYGDVVYTKIIPLTYDAKMTTLMSTDGAKTWRRVDLSCPFEKQLDSTYIPDRNWPMAGYKESMVSYCVGYRDGRRQDYIKILRPKKNTSEGLRGCR